MISILSILHRYQNIEKGKYDFLKNVLKTKNYREEDIEETQQSYEFIGNDRKPFHIITWLANKSIPADGTPGASSGFFFFETQRVRHFLYTFRGHNIVFDSSFFPSFSSSLVIQNAS